MSSNSEEINHSLLLDINTRANAWPQIIDFLFHQVNLYKPNMEHFLRTYPFL